MFRADMTDKGKEPGHKGGVVTKERKKTERPRLYKVIFHNDDFTTMEFVILVLQKFFDKDRTEATRVMLMVHHKGAGIAGAYSHDIAETKIETASDYARQHEMPLLITMEPE